VWEINRTVPFIFGARKTIGARGYPIEEVNKKALAAWFKELRTPGSGIVRI